MTNRMRFQVSAKWVGTDFGSGTARAVRRKHAISRRRVGRLAPLRFQFAERLALHRFQFCSHLSTSMLSAVAFFVGVGLLSSQTLAQDNSDPQASAQTRSGERLGDWQYNASIGILQPAQQAILRPSTTGTIQKLHVIEGQHVTFQQPLLTLDDRIAQARLEVAMLEAEGNAAQRTAEIDVHLRATELKLLRRAEANAAASQFEIDRKEGEYERALAVQESEELRKKQLQASVNLSQAELDTLTLSAPFDAYVLHIHKDIGNSIGPGEDAITVVQLEELKTELYLPVRFFNHIHEGQEFTLRTTGQDEMLIPAKVKFISPVVNSASGCFRCVFTVDNPRAEYAAGTKVSLDISQLEQRQSEVMTSTSVTVR